MRPEPGTTWGKRRNELFDYSYDDPDISMKVEPSFLTLFLRSHFQPKGIWNFVYPNANNKCKCDKHVYTLLRP